MTLVPLSHPTGDRSEAVETHAGADLPIVVLDAGWRAIGPEVLVDVDEADLAGSAVLLSTGWDRHWGTERYGHPTHPYLTAAGARRLVELGVALVGIDSVDVDDTSPAAGDARPTRAVLEAAGVPVLLDLTGIDLLPDVGARLSPEPATATTPARVVARLP